MENSKRKREHSENAFIETTEKASKWFAVLSAISFFIGYFRCLYLDIRDSKKK